MPVWSKLTRSILLTHELLGGAVQFVYALALRLRNGYPGYASFGRYDTVNKTIDASLSDTGTILELLTESLTNSGTSAPYVLQDTGPYNGKLIRAPINITPWSHDIENAGQTNVSTSGNRVTCSSGAAAHLLGNFSMAVTTRAENEWTCSARITPGNHRAVMLRFYQTTNTFANQVFDLFDAKIGDRYGGATRGEIQESGVDPVGDGSFICWATERGIGSFGSADWHFVSDTGGLTIATNGAETYTGAGTEYFDLTEWQVYPGRYRGPNFPCVRTEGAKVYAAPLTFDTGAHDTGGDSGARVIIAETQYTNVLFPGHRGPDTGEVGWTSIQAGFDTGWDTGDDTGKVVIAPDGYYSPRAWPAQDSGRTTFTEAVAFATNSFNFSGYYRSDPEKPGSQFFAPRVWVDTGSYVRAVINMHRHRVESVDARNDSGLVITIDDAPRGFKRFQIRGNFDANPANVGFGWVDTGHPDTGASGTIHASDTGWDSGSPTYFWGFMCIASNQPAPSLIPTHDVSVTKDADVVEWNLSQYSNSPIVYPGEAAPAATYLVDYQKDPTPGALDSDVLGFYDTGVNNYIKLQQDSGEITRLVIVDSGTGTQFTGTVDTGEQCRKRLRVGVAVAENNWAASVNAGPIVTDTGMNLWQPSGISRFAVTNTDSGAVKIYDVQAIGSRISNTELKDLTWPSSARNIAKGEGAIAYFDADDKIVYCRDTGARGGRVEHIQGRSGFINTTTSTKIAVRSPEDGGGMRYAMQQRLPHNNFHSNWQKFSTVLDTGVGILQADTGTDTGANHEVYVLYNNNSAFGDYEGPWTHEIEVKEGNWPYVWLNGRPNSGVQAQSGYFDLRSGEMYYDWIGASVGRSTHNGYAVRKLEDGWWRIAVTFNNTLYAHFAVGLASGVNPPNVGSSVYGQESWQPGTTEFIYIRNPRVYRGVFQEEAREINLLDTGAGYQYGPTLDYQYSQGAYAIRTHPTTTNLTIQNTSDTGGYTVSGGTLIQCNDPMGALADTGGMPNGAAKRFTANDTGAYLTVLPNPIGEGVIDTGDTVLVHGVFRSCDTGSPFIRFGFEYASSGRRHGWFNLIKGRKGTTSDTGLVMFMQQVGDGWWHCGLAGDMGPGDTGGFEFNMAAAKTDGGVASDTGIVFEVFGLSACEYDLADSPGMPPPSTTTQAATVTIDQDEVYWNFPAFYADPVTAFVDLEQYPHTTAESTPMTINGDTGADRFGPAMSSNAQLMQVVEAGSSVADLSYGTDSARKNKRSSIAVRIEDSNFLGYRDLDSGISQLSGTVAYDSVDQIALGNLSDGFDSPYAGQALFYRGGVFGRAFSDTGLQQLARPHWKWHEPDLLDGYTSGVALDGRGTFNIKDTGDNIYGGLNRELDTVITNSGTSAKLVTQQDGSIRWAPHNMAGVTYHNRFDSWTTSQFTHDRHGVFVATAAQTFPWFGFATGNTYISNEIATVTIRVDRRYTTVPYIGLCLYEGTNDMVGATFDLQHRAYIDSNQTHSDPILYDNGKMPCMVSWGEGSTGGEYVDSHVEKINEDIYDLSLTFRVPTPVATGDAVTVQIGIPDSTITAPSGSGLYTRLVSTTGNEKVRILHGQINKGRYMREYSPTGSGAALDWDTGYGQYVLWHEPAATNLFADSSKTAATNAVATQNKPNILPLDAQAWHVQSTGDTGTHFCSNDVTNYSSSINTMTVSTFVQYINHANVHLMSWTGAELPQAGFDISAGTITYQSAGVTARITPYRDNWWRLSITFSCSVNSSGYARVYISGQDTGGYNNSWNPTGFEQINQAHWQVEVGDRPSSVIPSWGATVTRDNDAYVARWNHSGFQNDATMLMECEVGDIIPTSDRLFEVSNDTGVELFTINGNTTAGRLNVQLRRNDNLTMNSSSTDTGLITYSSPLKVAFGFGDSGVAYANGAQLAKDTNTLDSGQGLTSCGIGCGYNATNDLAVELRLKSFRLINRRFTDTGMASWTTI